MRSILLIFWLSMVLTNVRAQMTRVDSLYHELNQATEDVEKVKIMIDLSKQYYNRDFFKSFEYAEQAIKLAGTTGNDSLLMSAYLSQGNNYLELGNYSQALEVYNKVLHWTYANSSPFLQAITNANIGVIHYHNNLDHEALQYFLKALKYFSAERLNVDPSVAKRRATLLNGVGIIYEEAKNYDSASYYYSASLQLALELKDHENSSNVLNNFGTLYRDQGNLELAEEHYLKALQIREQNNNRFGVARSNVNLGTFYFETRHDPDKAEPFLKKAIEIGKEIGALQTVEFAYSILYKLYESKKDYQKAFEALKEYSVVNDSLFNEENTRKIAQLEMQSEFEQKQHQQRADQKQKELYFIIGGIVLIFFLTLVTLLFFLQRSKTIRSQLEQSHLKLERAALKSDLATRDKELAANILYLLNKNELINTISEKLLDIKQQVNPESQAAVQKVVIDLQSNLQPELWQEFEFRFQQVHENFYKILNEKFPDLSPSERRLCAFLKLDMTTKEISAITHQNAKSIDVARTRLRKKLNLTGTDHNLVTFLAQLDKEVVQ